MNKKIIKPLVICMLSVFLLTITACDHYGGRHHSGRGNSDRLTSHIVSELDLDSRQEVKLGEVLSNFEEKREGLGKHDELRNIFVSQLKNKDLDEEYLRQETAQLIRELERISDEFITDLGSFHASLSEEQRGKLVNIINREKGLRSRHN